MYKDDGNFIAIFVSKKVANTIADYLQHEKVYLLNGEYAHPDYKVINYRGVRIKITRYYYDKRPIIQYLNVHDAYLACVGAGFIDDMQ